MNSFLFNKLTSLLRLGTERKWGHFLLYVQVTDLQACLIRILASEDFLSFTNILCPVESWPNWQPRHGLGGVDGVASRHGWMGLVATSFPGTFAGSAPKLGKSPWERGCGWVGGEASWEGIWKGRCYSFLWKSFHITRALNGWKSVLYQRLRTQVDDIKLLTNFCFGMLINLTPMKLPLWLSK